MRERTGLTLAEVARELGCSEGQLSKVEKGMSGMSKSSDVQWLLNRYGVADESDVEFILDLHRNSLSREWWAPYRNIMPSGMPSFLGLEGSATYIRAWQPTVVFGLLQAEGYMRAMFETAKPVDERTTAFVEHAIRLRTARKEIITREDNPTQLWCVMDEAMLLRVIGSADVMREQYEYLAEMSRRDNVRIQVLPRRSTGYKTSHNFLVMEMEKPLPTVVESDTAWGASAVIDKEADVWLFNRRFDELRANALGPDETPTIMKRLSGEV
ncbi:helix-turn-helix domain-containing protein [Streptomyces apocyni]|uniref:helix-turn-helix domain-containing protein n=1 Tax=Streptomyces apocyni TaxID=2654677 RepID=UPI001E3A90E6|nr:helix-turn-helix transcriptional regulator [Streptomyces apocyni]